MPAIDDLFVAHTARSGGFGSYKPGDTAFVTNGLSNNGVLGFVTPKEGDKVFEFVGIVLSAFLEATVQVPPFVARGNGGSGLIVLEPRQALSGAQLGQIAAYVNRALRWRFSWYRQASVARVRALDIPSPSELRDSGFGITTLLPTRGEEEGVVQEPLQYEPFLLGSLFDLQPGDYHSLADLPVGDTPIISCGELNNGVAGFVKVPKEHVYSGRLTVAFNGRALTTKHHAYEFAAKDDVAVCFPRRPLNVATELFIKFMLERERWRFSYYRKCYREKLRRLRVLLPSRPKFRR